MMRTLLLCGLLGSALCPLEARAQDESSTEEPGEVDAARAAYRAGVEAASESRWAESERQFRLAHELTGAPAAAFNQAIALRALGRYVEAAALFRSLLDAPDDPLEGARRRAAEAMLEECVEAIAGVELTALPTHLTLAIRVDGREHPHRNESQTAIPLNPGEHSIEVSAERRRPFRWSGSLEAGELVSLEVSLPELDLSDPTRPRRIALWVTAITVVLAAGAAVAWTRLARDELQPESPPRWVFEL